MGRNWGTAGDEVRIGSPVVLRQVDTFTWCALIRPVSNGTGNTVGRVASIVDDPPTITFKAIRFNFNNALRAEVDRATAIAVAVSETTLLTFNEEQFVAFSYSEADGPRIYHALMGSIPSEITYASRTVGSGTTRDDTAGVFIIGNEPNGGGTWDGKIGYFVFAPRILTVEEMTHVMAGKVLQDVKGFWPIWGFSPEPDLSGNISNGTLSGTTVVNGPPVGRYAPSRVMPSLLPTTPLPPVIQSRISIAQP